MSLTIETGAIVTGANSYISAADATTYHSARGNTAWTGTDAVKEAALLRAVAYLDGNYRKRWKGVKVRPVPTDSLAEQPLEWPRYDVQLDGYTANNDGYLIGWVFPFDQIPQRLKDAQCELALRALAGDLAADRATGIKREKVDVIETEYTTGSGSRAVYQIVDDLISDYLQPTGCGSLTRA
jgi:phage gp36-like protein